MCWKRQKAIQEDRFHTQLSFLKPGSVLVGLSVDVSNFSESQQSQIAFFDVICVFRSVDWNFSGVCVDDVVRLVLNIIR